MQMLKHVRFDSVEPLRRATTKMIRRVQFGMLFFAGIDLVLGMFIVVVMPVVVMPVVVVVFVVVVFVRYSGDLGCGVLIHAVGLRRQHEDRGPVLKRFECPSHCLVLGVVLRSMLKTDNVHAGHTKLEHRRLAFHNDVEGSMVMRMGVMLAVLVIRCQRGRSKEGGNQSHRRQHPERGV